MTQEAIEIDREQDRALGPTLEAERWIVIGGDHILWLHPPSRRSVSLEGPHPRKTERFDCLGVPCLNGEPADPTTEGYLVFCRVHDHLGNPTQGTGFWVESYGEALALARKLRASILAETPEVDHATQQELFPAVGAERAPQPWARKFLFVGYLGVVATRATMEAHEARLKEDPKAPPEGDLDPALVARLNEIVKRTGCDIVASKELRHGMSLPEISRLLRLRGLEADVFDATPGRARDEHGFAIEAPAVPIEKWLAPRNDVASFAILDAQANDDDHMGALGHRVVRTDPALGLQPADVERAVSLLETLR